MVVLKPGDRINCRIKDGEIVGAYKEYDETKTFEIVAIGDYGFYLFVPAYYSIKQTVPIDNYRLKKMSIDARFLHEEMIHITENMVYQIVQKLDGMPCSICKEFFPMAEANQENGTLICYACRQNPYH